MSRHPLCCFYFINLFLFPLIIIIVSATGVVGGISRNNFYDYGPEAGDTAVELGDQVVGTLAPLTYSYPFYTNPEFGFSILVDGYGIFHSTGDFIITFAADADTTYGGGPFYYRETTDPTILEKGRLEVISQFPQHSEYVPVSAIISTFLDIPFIGQMNPGVCNDQSLEIRNTYQLILLTDGTSCFAIFYYETIKWSRSNFDGSCTPQGNVNATQAFVGFALEEGTIFEFGGSRTNDVINIDDGTNYVSFDGDSSGMYIFQIDGATPEPPVPYECPNLVNPEHGSVSVSGQSVGSVAQFTCNLGYALVGQSQLTCQQVNSNPPEWSDDTPTCASICPIHPRRREDE